jgi:Ca2+-transporting ATPase
MSTPPPEGLTTALAAQRHADEGPNELSASQKRSVWDMAFDVVREPMFLLLMGAGSIYLALGDTREAFVLLGFVFIIMGVTLLQERRTDNALEALRDLSSPRAKALRDGQMVRIPGREVVRDDVLMLAEGDRIPADGDLLQAHELATDESMLTGESEPVPKTAIDRVFAGTLVVSGQGVMRVTAIGQATSLGHIGQSLGTIALQASPLREEMTLLTRRLLIVGSALCVLLIGLFWLVRGGLLDAILSGITLAMGVLPQELPVIMIVFLALAARRLAAQQVLTRRLNAIETLGQTTVLCVDKTGTLTQNRMAVASLVAGHETQFIDHLSESTLAEPFQRLLEYAVLASETTPHDPMEQAIHRMANPHLARMGLEHPDWTLAREYELSSDLLAMSHVWRSADVTHDCVAAKGAPEAVADLCHLSEEQRKHVEAQATHLAHRGLRVLAVAKASHPADQPWPECQHDFVFEWMGMVGLADPLRTEVPAAVRQCRAAGMRVVMITGDHPRTAGAIAAQAGIDDTQVLTGDELRSLSPEDLTERVARVSVFARVKPEQKLALVEAFKARGEVVAMTGDGVNDAPALKAAHIGIAMGQRGTDVAREAAALVLLDDNFATIVQAIHRGRRTFANLRQAMVYTLAVHVPIIGLAILPVLFGFPLILAPLHIAFLELVIDPTCSLVFEAETGNTNLMAEPPRGSSEPLLSRRLVILSVLQGSLITAAVLGMYVWLLGSGLKAAVCSNMTFVILVAANAALILPSRSRQTTWRSVWKGLTPVSLWVLGCTLLALSAISTLPMLAVGFGFEALTVGQWALAMIAGLGLTMPLYLLKHTVGRVTPKPTIA